MMVGLYLKHNILLKALGFVILTSVTMDENFYGSTEILLSQECEGFANHAFITY